jgi:hypothetical protein
MEGGGRGVSEATAPLINALVVREFVRGLLRRTHPSEQRVVLLHGRYEAGSEEQLSVEGHPVRVADCPSVLSVLEAQVHHTDGLLVILTPRSDEELGHVIRSRAVKHRTLRIHRWEIVLRRFGARELDPRLRRLSWAAEGLLSVENGLKVPGAILDYDTALRHLVQRRLDLASDSPDLADLLTWSLDRENVGRLVELGAEERAGLESWLVHTAGPAANVLFTLVRSGHGTDSLPFALVADMLWNPNLAAGDPAVARAQGRAQGHAETFIEGSVDTAAVLTLAQTARGITTRWIARASDADPAAAEAHQYLDLVVRRADALLTAWGAEPLARHSTILPSGLRARLDELSEPLERALDGSPDEAEQVLQRVEDHDLAALRAEWVAPARTAVRLARWLNTAMSPPSTVAEGLSRHVRAWGFVDRALSVLWRGDLAASAGLAAAYQRTHDAARAVRDDLDKVFAARLAAWAPEAAPGEGLLLVENVLERIALPLAHGTGPAPLILILDGMSSAVACQLAEQIRNEDWVEISRDAEGRQAALAAIPSLTTLSRASLLCGTLRTGGPDVERAGFGAFWKRHRTQAALFHKGDLVGGVAERLSAKVNDVLSRAEGDDREVVGVVLNTIDDTLDKGREGGRVDWAINDVNYLRELLTAAKLRGRPLVLVSDHGHVLEREHGRPSGEDASAARWRSAATPPGPGEVELSGPRVLMGDGRVVVPWRETIRYTARKAGYHGGASLTEMTVPVLTFLPTADTASPTGWHLLPRERTIPNWWSPASADSTAGIGVAPHKPRPAMEIRSAPDIATIVSTLGSRVIGTETYREQKRYVRKPPKDHVVTSIIDEIIRSGGTLSVTAIAELAGTSAMRVPGLLATLRTLLNVESYPVLSVIDGGRTAALDVDLLRTQFGLLDLE